MSVLIFKIRIKQKKMSSIQTISFNAYAISIDFYSLHTYMYVKYKIEFTFEITFQTTTKFC